MTEIGQCIGSLLHAVHDEGLGEPSAETALLQYCGLLMLQQATSRAPLEWSTYNDACWAVRHLVDRPAIRFSRCDPINEPPRPIPFTRTVLLVPNNTNLDSASTLVAQASKRHPCERPQHFEIGAALGSVVGTRTQGSDHYDEVWHLVCRQPGQPRLLGLEPALERLVAPSEEVLCLRAPVFGSDSDWDTWASGLRLWHAARRTIQESPVFLELCFIPDSLSVAEGIRSRLSAKGVPFEWPGHA